MGKEATAQDEPTSNAFHWTRVVLVYLIALVAATWPYALTISSHLPSLGDPLQHMWIMRWYQTALTQGRSPLHCPDIQYPLGAPLANFSPLHLQSLLYLIVSTFVHNHILVFNVVWMLGFLTTGLGTYALAKWAVGNDRAALLAGLLAMLSGPMLVHSHAHLELMFVGGFPLFMLAWIRFLETPSVRGLMLAVAGVLLVTMSAAYYLIFLTVCGALYLLYRAIRARREGEQGWTRRRLMWLAGFAFACLPFLAILFAAQLAGLWEGHRLTRPRVEFDAYRMPLWSYLVPAPGNRLAQLLPDNPHATARLSGESMAYLGMITLGLMLVAAWSRTPLRLGRFWWFLLASTAVFSMGSFVSVWGHKLSLPAGWLWDWFPPFHLIRVPTRFKFFAAVVAAVLAAAGYSVLDSRIRGRSVRFAMLLVVGILAVLDLGHTPYDASPVPELPQGYTWLLERDPDAVWVDVPQMGSGHPDMANPICAYWQSLHRGRTTAGYSGHIQWELDNLVTWNSPFFSNRLKEPGFLAPGTEQTFDLVGQSDPYAYMWLYLKRFQIPYVVLHKWADSLGPYHQYGNLRALLAPARIYEDSLVEIYERDRLPVPARPAALCAEGWLTRAETKREGYFRPVSENAKLAVFVPREGCPLVLGLRARALGRNREARIEFEGRELARWRVSRDSQEILASPAFRLPQGLHELTLVTEGSVPAGKHGHRLDLVTEPISLLVSGVCLRTANDAERLALEQAEGRLLH